MRWHVLRALLHKEALRHLANRGGLALVLLLILAALLLSALGGEGPAAGLLPGVRLCYVDYWEDGPLVEHLRESVPPELAEKVRFRLAAQVPTDAAGTLLYPSGAGAIQLRPGDAPGRCRVWIWHPGDDAGLAPFEAWFWKESLRFCQASRGAAELVSPVEAQRSGLTGGPDRRAGLATALVLFGLFLVCVYLLASLTCEERERGTLLAQALSPAAPREIVAAKLLFYPAVGLALAAALAGAYRPAVLARPAFWLPALAAAFGATGLGLTVASLARTQRAAGLGALCYTLAVALFLLGCQQAAVPTLPWLALEHHTPRLLHAALAGADLPSHGGHLAAAGALACAWVGAAAFLFRRCGWQ